MECSQGLCVTSGNNVGIGTDSPAQKLEVNGNILASGDMCNGSGKCLSSVFQTNVIAGTNPTCSTGQTAIMKAYNGTWYTADNASITSWNKVTCGAQMTTDGTPLIYNDTSHTAHTQKNCTDSGGTVVSDGTYNMCRFTAASCLSGWTQYGSWSTTTSDTLTATGSYGSTCTNAAGHHSWSNTAKESNLTFGAWWSACNGGGGDNYQRPCNCATSCATGTTCQTEYTQYHEGPTVTSTVTVTQTGCY